MHIKTKQKGAKGTTNVGSAKHD
jgi:DNA-directed RNA polymerase II subunit RPB2